jgi:hypothetical protein
MTLIIKLPLTDRFSFLIKGLLTDVVAEVRIGWVAVPLIKLLWWRLRRMSTRFAAIMAQYQAGTLPAAGAARRLPAPAAPADAASPPAEPHPTARPRPLELLRADGSIWMRLGASTTWRKPGLLWHTLEEAQKFDPPVRIWPRD